MRERERDSNLADPRESGRLLRQRSQHGVSRRSGSRPTWRKVTAIHWNSRQKTASHRACRFFLDSDSLQPAGAISISVIRCGVRFNAFVPGLIETGELQIAKPFPDLVTAKR